jgi:hypothetical protein
VSDFGWRLSSDFRLSDYDQRLSRSEVSDFGWRLSDYDRPPSFRVEVRRFSDLLTGWRVPVVVPGLADLVAAGSIASRCRECAEIQEKKHTLK